VTGKVSNIHALRHDDAPHSAQTMSVSVEFSIPGMIKKPFGTESTRRCGSSWIDRSSSEARAVPAFPHFGQMSPTVHRSLAVIRQHRRSRSSIPRSSGPFNIERAAKMSADHLMVEQAEVRFWMTRSFNSSAAV